MFACEIPTRNALHVETGNFTERDRSAPKCRGSNAELGVGRKLSNEFLNHFGHLDFGAYSGPRERRLDPGLRAGGCRGG